MSLARDSTPVPPPVAPPEASRPAAARTPSLAAAVRTVASITLLSRITGLARDVLLARLFGATLIGSAFAAGFAIPNTFRRLFGEGALTAAFIPEYTQAQQHDPALAQRIAAATVLVLLLATTAIAVLIEVALLGILIITPHSPGRTLSIQLIMLMLPFMPLVCIAAILSGILQVHGRFAPASAGPLVLNGFIIAGAAWNLFTGHFASQQAAYMLGGITVASGLTQCAWFFFLLRRHLGIRLMISSMRAADDAARSSLRRIRRRFVPALIGMGTLQISALMDMLIAMWPIWFGAVLFGVAYPLDERSNAILTFTQRLYQFPLGVFGIAVATAAFPLLSRHAGQPSLFLDTLRRGLRLSLFIGLPASIGLILVRHDLTAVLFSGGRGGFGPDDLARSAAVLLGYAPAVWAYSLNHVYTRAFYAGGDTATPVKIAAAALGINLLLNVVLIWHFREAGLAWATSIAALTQCGLLAFILRRRLGAPLLDTASRSAFAQVLTATIIMAAAVVLVLWITPPVVAWRGHARDLALAAATGATVYLAAAAMMRSEELRALLKLR
jgi:putative peptidoglycan lipid II flippase